MLVMPVLDVKHQRTRHYFNLRPYEHRRQTEELDSRRVAPNSWRTIETVYQWDDSICHCQSVSEGSLRGARDPSVPPSPTTPLEAEACGHLAAG